MSNILDFEFEELPLFITKEGIPAGLISGMAAIEYDRDGFVGIDSVSIEGWQQLTPEERARGVRPWVYVKAPAELGAHDWPAPRGRMVRSRAGSCPRTARQRP